MPKKNSPLTPEIIIATLKRSNLKTVLIEGKDDLLIYNNIEKELNNLDISFLPCNGRNSLLEVYKERESINSEILFICDSDLWIFEESKENECLITTKGYSIENELYQDGAHIINGLLSSEELKSKNAIISNICEWFAYEVEKYLDGKSSDCKFSEVSILNTSIMERNRTEFTVGFLAKRQVAIPNEDLSSDIKKNYHIKLRGKYLFQVYEKIFQERGKNEVKYRKDQLFDLIYRLVSNTNDDEKILNKRKIEIKEFFQD